MGFPFDERQPPHSVETEAVLLGAMLVSTSAAETGLAMLSAEDFHLGAHEKVFAAIAALRERDQPADEFSVADELERRGQLEQAGGRIYIGRLNDGAGIVQHADHYAGIVAEKARLRRLIQTAHGIIDDCYQQERESAEIVLSAETTLTSLAQRKGAGEFVPTRAIAQAMTETLAEPPPPGIPSGLRGLDWLTNGWAREDFVILGGRSGMGKTGLACNFAVAAAEAGYPVGIFSLEMSRELLMRRMLANVASLDGMAMLRRGLAGEEMRVASRALGYLGDLPIQINDRAGMTLSDLRADALRMVRKHGTRLFILDHIQRVRESGRVESTHQFLSKLAAELKNLARELGVPWIALSQLSRRVEQREDKRPMLSDLRESGSLEAEADQVLLLYREQYYRRRAAVEAGQEVRAENAEPEEAEIIVAKNRNGCDGTVRVAYVPAFQRFSDLARFRDEEVPPEHYSGRFEEVLA